MEYFNEVNVNPLNRRTGDCVIRAISTALNQDWHITYWGLCLQGAMLCDMPSGNGVWASYLKDKGYKRYAIPNDCDCYTVEDFCKDNPEGTFILGTGTHALCVKDGKYFDIWNSGNEIPEYYFKKDEG